MLYLCILYSWCDVFIATFHTSVLYFDHVCLLYRPLPPPPSHPFSQIETSYTHTQHTHTLFRFGI